jgi:2-octaprenyl-6-methoxyphenol hydroxylase
MSLRIAVIGAGPAGLALALHAARALPRARLTVFDARPVERDVSADPRTLALALGSVQWLQQLDTWPATAAEPITAVQVSQAPPSPGGAAVWLRASDQQVPMLGAVLSYGALVAPLQAAWQAAVDAEPTRLTSRFGTAVSGLKPLPAGVEVDAGIAEAFDLAVVAEGGVFAEQARKAIAHDYGQTAWVGT